MLSLGRHAIGDVVDATLAQPFARQVGTWVYMDLSAGPANTSREDDNLAFRPVSRIVLPRLLEAHDLLQHQRGWLDVTDGQRYGSETFDGLRRGRRAFLPWCPTSQRRACVVHQ